MDHSKSAAGKANASTSKIKRDARPLGRWLGHEALQVLAEASLAAALRGCCAHTATCHQRASGLRQVMGAVARHGLQYWKGHPFGLRKACL